MPNYLYIIFIYYYTNLALRQLNTNNISLFVQRIKMCLYYTVKQLGMSDNEFSNI